MNPYKILGVKKKATIEEIRASYIDLAKKYHPDTDGGDHEKFIELKRAYEILKDEKLRKAFDETGTVPGEHANLIYESAIHNIQIMFNQILQTIQIQDIGKVDILKMLREMISDLLITEKAQIEQLEHKKNKYIRARETIEKKMRRKKNKKSRHIFLIAIDQNISNCESEIFPKKQKVETMDKALEILEDYEMDLDEIKLMGPIFRGAIFTVGGL